MQSLQHNVITSLTLPDNVLVDIARYSSPSVILCMVCTCKSIHGIDELIAKRLIPSNDATTFVFAMSTVDEKDAIAEYVASGELRHFNIDDNFDETFETFCDGYIEYLCHQVGFIPCPRLILDSWREFELGSIRRSDSYRLRANQCFTFFKITRQFECPVAMVLPSIVVDRHWYQTDLHYKAPLVDIRHVAHYLLQQNIRPEAAQLLKEVLMQDPFDLDANYILGIMHLNGDGVVRDESYAYTLLNAAVDQQHPWATLQCCQLHFNRGDFKSAQVTFDRGLLLDCRARRSTFVLEDGGCMSILDDHPDDKSSMRDFFRSWLYHELCLFHVDLDDRPDVVDQPVRSVDRHARNPPHINTVVGRKYAGKTMYSCSCCTTCRLIDTENCLPDQIHQFFGISVEDVRPLNVKASTHGSARKKRGSRMAGLRRRQRQGKP